MAERIRLSRARGWRLPEGAVAVSRPSRWGNPYIVGQDGTRAQCAALFGQLVRGFICFHGRHSVDEQLTFYRRIRRHAGDLTGKDLACWCPIDSQPCHADILLVLANPEQPSAPWLREPIDIGRFRLGMSASSIEKLNRAKARKQREGTS